jgi:hypothetical protein
MLVARAAHDMFITKVAYLTWRNGDDRGNGDVLVPQVR